MLEGYETYDYKWNDMTIIKVERYELTALPVVQLKGRLTEVVILWRPAG